MRFIVSTLKNYDCLLFYKNLFKFVSFNFNYLIYLNIHTLYSDSFIYNIKK